MKNTLRVKSDEGFTLIEVMIAMAIFLIGFLAVGTMQISAVNGNASARMRTEATVLATEIVEQLMAIPYNSTGYIGPYSTADPLEDTNLALEVETYYPGPSVADFVTNPGSIYKVQWSVNVDDPRADTKTIAVTVSWQKRGRDNEVNLSFVAANANM